MKKLMYSICMRNEDGTTWYNADGYWATESRERSLYTSKLDTDVLASKLRASAAMAAQSNDPPISPNVRVICIGEFET